MLAYQGVLLLIKVLLAEDGKKLGPEFYGLCCIPIKGTSRSTCWEVREGGPVVSVRKLKIVHDESSETSLSSGAGSV